MKTSLTIFLLFFAPILMAQLRVDNQGNVGVGTTQPNETFHVFGNGLFSTDSSGNYGGALINGKSTFSTELSPDYTWNNDESTGIFHPQGHKIGITANGTQTASFDPWATIFRTKYGVLCKSLNNFNSTFHVQTKLNYGNQYHYSIEPDNNGFVFWVQSDGDIFANGSWYMSDRSLKYNFEAISEPEAILNSLTGYLYNLNHEAKDPFNPKEIKRVGVIAQDVYDVLPEAVRKLENGLMAVNYSSLVAVLIEGYNNSYDKIESLSQRISELESLIASQGYSHSINEFATSLHTDESRLDQNAPNPFTERTIIKYYVQKAFDRADIRIYNLNGVQLKSFNIAQAGDGSVTVSGQELQPGIYLYSLLVDGNEIDTKRMILTD